MFSGVPTRARRSRRGLVDEIDIQYGTGSMIRTRRTHVSGRVVAVVSLLGVMVLSPWVAAQTGTVMPTPTQQFFDDDGTVCAGCKLYTSVAGTSTPQATYADAALSSAHTNPIVLDAAGRATIFLAAASYKFQLTDAHDATIWTQDHIQATQLSQSLVGETKFLGGSPAIVIADSAYPSGSTGNTLAPGTVRLPLDSGDLTGAWQLRGMLRTEGGTVTAALVNLTDGPNTTLVTISSTSTTGAQVTSGTITFAAPGTAKDYAVKLQVSGGHYAWGWGFELIRTH